MPRIFSRTHLPRATGEVRFATEVTSRKLAWPSKPAARVVRSRGPGGSGCREHPECRSASPASRPRKCNPRSADRPRCDPRAGCFRAATPSRVRKACRRLSLNSCASGRCALQLAQVQPLIAEAGDQRLRFGSASMRRVCCFEHRRFVQLVLHAPARAARRRGCCSTGRRKAARPVPGR